MPKQTVGRVPPQDIDAEKSIIGSLLLDRDAIIAVAYAKDIAGEVFNIGSSAEYTIEDVAQICARLVSVTLEEQHSDLPVDDPKRRKPDLSKISTRFKWSAQIGLEEGIMRTIEYFRNLKK